MIYFHGLQYSILSSITMVGPIIDMTESSNISVRPLGVGEVYTGDIWNLKSLFG